jgi:hypothetical protein
MIKKKALIERVQSLEQENRELKDQIKEQRYLSIEDLTLPTPKDRENEIRKDERNKANKENEIIMRQAYQFKVENKALRESLERENFVLQQRTEKYEALIRSYREVLTNVTKALDRAQNGNKTVNVVKVEKAE